MINSKIKYISITSLFAALICVISPFSISVGVIPFSFSTFIIYIIGALSKKSMSFISILIYIFIGIIGLPVFSNFTGGIGSILGPTGGFIIGYIPCIFIISLFVNIRRQNILLYPLSMIIGTLILYIFGCIWFMIQAQNTFIESLIITVLPFILFDIIKIILASICSYIINNKTPYKEMVNNI